MMMSSFEKLRAVSGTTVLPQALVLRMRPGGDRSGGFLGLGGLHSELHVGRGRVAVGMQWGLLNDSPFGGLQTLI